MRELSLNAFGDRMVELLPRLMKELTRYENNYVTSGKITVPQFVVLSCLRQYGECQMGCIAGAMNISFSTATGMMDRLLKQGLVKRSSGQNDRRTVVVMITAKGRRIVEEVYAQKRLGIMELFSALSASERKRYLEILEKLVSSLSKVQCKGEAS